MIKRTLLPFVVFSILCHLASAQVADTIKVEFNEQTQLQYIFNNPKDFKTFENVNLDSLTEELSNSVAAFDANIDTALVLGAATPKDHHDDGKGMFLEITPKLGANLVRNTLVPDYGLRLGLGSHGTFEEQKNGDIKARWRNTYFIEYQHMLFFTARGVEGYNQFGNGFVNIGYNREVKGSEYSMSLGYLVKQNGPYFGEHTVKFDFNIPVQENLSLSPFMIVTDNFNSYLPGIRLTVLR